MLTPRKHILCSFLVTFACIGSSQDPDSDPGDPPDANEIGSKAPRLVIDVIEAGAVGAVQVRSGGAGGSIVATCDRDCTVPLAAGTTYAILATSPSTTEITGVCAAADECTFTAALGAQNAAVAFRTDAATNEEWAVTLSEPLHAAAFDGAGNLLTGGATTLFKLSPAGATIWTQPIAPIAIATGPGDTIYVHAGANLVKLDASGAQLWSRAIPAGARGCANGFALFVHCVAVGSDGAVVVRGSSQLARWDAAGTPIWTIAHPNDGNFALAIDAADVVHTTEEGPDFETRTLARFGADGTPLDPVDAFCEQYNARLTVNAGAVDCTSSGHSFVHGITSIRVPDPDDVPNGMAGTGIGDRGWVFFQDDQPLPLTGEYRMFRSGATSWETRGGAREIAGTFDVIGALPHDLAGSAAGRLALVGRYDGFDPAPVRGWVKSFAP